MTEQNYLFISATVFAVVALLQCVRLLYQWSVQVAGITVPLWGSWLALFVATSLSVSAFRLVYRWRSSH